MAMADEITVTHSRSAMPKRSSLPLTCHTREVRKFAWSFASDGTAWLTRKAPTSTTMMMTSQPAPEGGAAEDPVAETAGAGTVTAAGRLRAFVQDVDGRRHGRHRGLLACVADAEWGRNAAGPSRDCPGHGKGCAVRLVGDQLMASMAVATLVRTESGSGA